MSTSGISLHSAVIAYVEALHAEGTSRTTIVAYRSVLHRLCARFPHRTYRGRTTKELMAFL